MKGFGLRIVLQEDCVLSERSATEGGHAGLDFIPGSALLGAAAALYRELDPADAFTLFHSGKVRFGDGLPVGDSGQPAFPIPLCWHQVKGESAQQNGSLISDRVWHMGRIPGGLDGRQPQQLRAGYITESGIWVEPAKALRMKTAIDPDTGRAREAALFGYEALCAGQSFVTSINADDDVSDQLLERVRSTITGEVLLGRSRSAEYGRASTSDSGSQLLPRSGDATGKVVTLWLLADLAPLDGAGLPTLCPKPEWLGLPPGQLLIDRSFLRSRRYSPWNAYRGAPDLERQVIQQGSVLVFELDRPLDNRGRTLIGAGLGTCREAGLGQVWLDPPMLEGEHPQFLEPRAAQESPKVGRPTSPLLDWLVARHDQQGGQAQRAAEARDLAKGYRKLLASARRIKGLDPSIEIGPSHSQWGSVLALAKSTSDTFARRLFDERNGPCKPEAPGWRDDHWNDAGQETRTFAAWLRDILGRDPDPRFVQLLAREIMSELKQETRR